MQTVADIDKSGASVVLFGAILVGTKSSRLAHSIVAFVGSTFGVAEVLLWDSILVVSERRTGLQNKYRAR